MFTTTSLKKQIPSSYSTLCFVSCLLLFNSCKDGKSTSSNLVSNDSYLTANINGDAFVSTLEIVAFKANGQTYLATADNFGHSEYEFKLIIENKKDAPDPTIKRYGFIELKDSNGNRKNNKTWALTNNFNFTITNDVDGALEGTFSFTATPTGKNSSNQVDLILTEGKFKANKKRW